MDFDTFILAIISSGIITTAITVFFNDRSNKKILELQSNYQKDIEEFKSNISTEYEIKQKIMERKIDAMREFGDSTYRAKLTAFYLSHPEEKIPKSIDNKETIDDRIDSLIGLLGKYNSDIGKTKFYLMCHAYKNTLINLKKLLLELNDINIDKRSIMKEIQETYDDIEKCYKKIKETCDVTELVHS